MFFPKYFFLLKSRLASELIAHHKIVLNPIIQIYHTDIYFGLLTVYMV